MATNAMAQQDMMHRILDDMNRRNCNPTNADAFTIGTMRTYVNLLVSYHARSCGVHDCDTCIVIDNMKATIMASRVFHGASADE